MKKENAYIMKRKTPFKNLESLDGKIDKVADFVATEKMCLKIFSFNHQIFNR